MKSIKKIFSRFKLAFSLGANIQSVGSLLFVGFMVPITSKIGFAKKEYKIKIKKFGNTCDAYISDGSDIGVLEEMFIEEEYAIDLQESPKVIFDLGSNAGFSVLYFKLKYPDAHIIACEADPMTAKVLVKNTSQFNNVTVLPVAVGNQDGEATFYVYPNSSMSSSLTQRNSNQHAIKVQIKRLETILQEEGIKTIDLLKFDIEGAEFNLFKTFDTIGRVRACIGEIHLDLIGVDKESMMQCFSGFTTKEISINTRRFILKAWNKNN